MKMAENCCYDSDAILEWVYSSIQDDHSFISKIYSTPIKFKSTKWAPTINVHSQYPTLVHDAV